MKPTTKIQDVKLQNLIIDLLDGEARYLDFNGEESGSLETNRDDLHTLHGAKIMDSFTINAAPACIRDCEIGRITVTILDRWVDTEDGGHHVTIQVHDNMGMVGGYPDFETFQTVDITGIHRLVIEHSPL